MKTKADRSAHPGLETERWQIHKQRFAPLISEGQRPAAKFEDPWPNKETKVLLNLTNLISVT